MHQLRYGQNVSVSGGLASTNYVLNNALGWSVCACPASGDGNYQLEFFLNGTKASSDYLSENGYAHQVRIWGSYNDSSMFSRTDLTEIVDFASGEQTSFSLEDLAPLPTGDFFKNYSVINLILYKKISDGDSVSYVQVLSEMLPNPMPRYWVNIRPDDYGTNVGIFYVHNNEANVSRANLVSSSLKIVFDAFNEFDPDASGGVSDRNSLQYSYSFSELPDTIWNGDSMYLAQVPCYYLIKNYLIIRIQLRNAQSYGLAETFFHNKNPYAATVRQLEALEARVTALENAQ